MQSKINKFAMFFCTSFGIGHLTSFPGTFASFLILPVIWYLKKSDFFNIFFVFCIFFIFCYFLCFLALKSSKNKDPSCIVIDEYVGQFLTLLFCEETIVNYIFGFLFFRFFDIVKPFPISIFDKLDNSFGLMMDDIIAGLFSAFFLYIIFGYL